MQIHKNISETPYAFQYTVHIVDTLYTLRGVTTYCGSIFTVRFTGHFLIISVEPCDTVRSKSYIVDYYLTPGKKTKWIKILHFYALKCNVCLLFTIGRT